MSEQIIVLPNTLTNPVFLSGMNQPLFSVADILDEQDKPEFALALREAWTIIDTFNKVCILKTHKLYTL